MALHQSGTNKNLNVYGDASVTGALTVAGTDVITTLDTKAPIANPTFTGTVVTPAITLNGTSLQTTLDSKATQASPTFTGTLTLNDASSNLVLSVDSASKISTLCTLLQVQSDTSATGTIYSNNATCLTEVTASATYAPKASPTFTGTVTTPSVNTFIVPTSSGIAAYGNQVTDSLEMRTQRIKLC